MNPIFDEFAYAENLLKNGFITFMSIRDLKILAKYYFYIGHEESQVVVDLQEFCKKFNPQYNEILAEEKIERAIKYGKNEKIKLPIRIEVTKNELTKIKQIKNYKYEKILFCLLFMAKYNRKVFENKYPDRKFNGRYFVNGSIAPALSMAKVYAKRIVQCDIKADLHECGYFDSNTNHKNQDGGFELFYLDQEWNQEDIAVVITDLNNIVLAYPIYCEDCGKELDKKFPKHNKCKECYKIERKATFLNHNR